MASEEKIAPRFAIRVIDRVGGIGYKASLDS